jgi:nucleotide-binding universal stress UspA family protein
VVGVPRVEGLKRVIEVVAGMAAAIDAEVHVVAAQRFLLDDRTELAGRLRDVEAKLTARGLKVKSHQRRGDLAASLIREAVRCSARLIVVDGTEPHASTPLLGSTWDHVSHHAPCNVLVAR